MGLSALSSAGCSRHLRCAAHVSEEVAQPSNSSACTTGPAAAARVRIRATPISLKPKTALISRKEPTKGTRSATDIRQGKLHSESMAHRWQLIDRPAEFGAIRSALTGRESGGVVLVGPAGVGKTTLARTVTESLRSQVHWVGARSPRAASRWAFSRIWWARQHRATRSRSSFRRGNPLSVKGIP